MTAEGCTHLVASKLGVLKQHYILLEAKLKFMGIKIQDSQIYFSHI